MTGLGTTLRERPDAPDAPPPDVKSGYVTAGLAIAGLVAYSVATDNALYLVGALIFFVGLLLSVVLHEAGHFFTARRFGMKATQFFVGFGPTLWSRHSKGVEYGVKAVPAGGFVKIIGMTPLEEVDPGDEDRAFFRFPARQKTVVLAAGSIVHFIIALVLIFLSVWLIGLPREVSPGVAAVAPCIAPDPVIAAGTSDADANKIIDDASATDPCKVPGSIAAPAQAAGLAPGDVVTAVNGRAVGSSDALRSALRAAPGTPLVLTVRAEGGTRQVTVTPAAVRRFAPVEPDDTTFLQAARRPLVVAGTVGITVQPRKDTISEGFVGSFRGTADLIGDQLEGIKNVVTDKLPTITRIYSDDRDPEGFIGVVGAGRISGEILESEETTSFKVLQMLSVVAGLNLFVGLFNLLPLLPLDGGHIAVTWFESARDKLRRLRGYTGEIRRVDYTKLLPLTYVVAGTFAVFTLLLVGADIVNPVRIPT